MPQNTHILAAGFNAHGQISPSRKPKNIYSLTKVGQTTISDKTTDKQYIKTALWSSTVVVTDKDGRQNHLGVSGDASQSDEVDLQHISDECTFFGDISGIKGYLDPFKGTMHILEGDGRLPMHSFPPSHPSSIHKREITHVAIAGNEKICIATRTREISGSFQAQIYVYPSLHALCEGSETTEVYDIEHESITSLTATATAFCVLTGDGKILTFGDARYPDLLARIPTSDSPVSMPVIVAALDGIRIRKVAAGSWIAAALSAEKDVYVWGHLLPPTPIREDHAGLDGLLRAVDEEVCLVDVADGADIEDVAVGDEHILVLTTEGEVWGLGSNESGQLGLGEELKGTKGKWVKIDMPVEGGKTVEMKAGPLTTFLVVVTDDVPEETIPS